MASKEKAMHLVEKMYFSRRYKNGEDYIAQQAWLHAIKCALIAVDEKINLFRQIILDFHLDENEKALNIYRELKEVKTEIEKL